MKLVWLILLISWLLRDSDFLWKRENNGHNEGRLKDTFNRCNYLIIIIIVKMLKTKNGARESQKVEKKD